MTTIEQDIDLIGFAGELQKQFVEPLRAGLRTEMRGQELTEAVGEHFEGKLVGTSATSVNVDKLLKLYDSGKLTRKRLVECIRADVAAVKKVLDADTLERISETSAGADQLRITRRKDVDVTIEQAAAALAAAAASQQ